MQLLLWPSDQCQWLRAQLSSVRRQRNHGCAPSHEPDLGDYRARPYAVIALPDEPYEYAEWKRCRVNLDYHVEIDKHYYSVPYSLARQEALTDETLEQRLYPPAAVAAKERRPQPDWAAVRVVSPASRFFPASRNSFDQR